MTDPLTDAVRRLKQLQEEVERLKSGQNEEGEPRLLFQLQDRATASEVVAIGPDETNAETVLARGRQASLVDNDLLNTDTATAADAQTKLVDNNVVHADTGVADDIQEDLRLQRSVVDLGAWNSIGYNTASFENVDIVRLGGEDAATASTTRAVVSRGDIPVDETGAVIDRASVATAGITGSDAGVGSDALALSGGPLETATYNSGGYATTTYQ